MRSRDQDYVFANAEERQEWERLTLIEREFDTNTRRHLQALGLGPGASRLEVGPGAGSVVRWMLEQVGDSGRVVAIDLDTRFIEHIRAHTLEVRRADIVTADLKRECFDFVHARYVVMHIPQYRKALDSIVRSLAPGG
jgi:ubiquinone/menaquinone biosynthesis C-methylase UbiE